MDDYFICPVCGAEVPMNAASCKECGSDDRTGWSADTAYDGIASDEFDTEFDAVFGASPPRKKSAALIAHPWFIRGVIAILLITLIWFLTR